MTSALSPRAQRVQDALDALDVDSRVVELSADARTASGAAAAVGCEVRQVAQSLLFRALESGRAVLVIASAVNRVDRAWLAELIGEPVELAHPDWVREQTGFSVGGVPPIPHDRHVLVFLDEDLMELDAIWGAAGTPSAVFRLTPGQLRHLTRGRVISLG